MVITYVPLLRDWVYLLICSPDGEEKDNRIIDLLPIFPLWSRSCHTIDRLCRLGKAGQDIQAPFDHLRCLCVPPRLGLRRAQGYLRQRGCLSNGRHFSYERFDRSRGIEQPF